MTLSSINIALVIEDGARYNPLPPLADMANDDCGPVDDSALYGQANHISTAIWNGGFGEKLTIRQSTSNLGQWRLHEYQVHLLQQWGFGIFVQNGVGIVDPTENEISQKTYMDWYYNITKLKIVPPSRATKDPSMYQQPRNKCDVSKAMDLIITTARGMSGLCLHEMPPVFHDSILPTYVRSYDELMLETFGPTYERPDFKNVLPKRKARRTTESTSQPFESEYFRKYEAYEQTTSDPFESTQYDVGPSAPQYEVGHLNEKINLFIGRL
ncbi:hypothetical protein ACET3Z_018125 [Daucus carota]